MTRCRGMAVVLGLGLMAIPRPAGAQSAEELKRLTLDELMKVEISTVTRQPETIDRLPAAVFVITGDDIRRSGAQSIPEALRLAPGMQVARIDSARWSVGMRGFADRLARAMLVLIDGRAVYSPLFAGTYWETQDVLLEDVERIEIIRGPGGTLWGANAVTGIINIVTKSARMTRGWLVTAAAGGPVERASTAVRYGGSAGAGGDFRVYVKGFNRGAAQRPGGSFATDDWWATQIGARADWDSSSRRTFTLQTDLYRAALGQRVALAGYEPPFSETISKDAPLWGANVLARWTESVSPTTRLQVQTYYDRTSRDETPVAETRDTFDMDLQMSHRRWARNSLVWGAGVRLTSGRIDAVGLSSIVPVRRTDRLFSAFAQNEVRLVGESLMATVGAKLEHNDYSGAEIQPSVRVAWTPERRHSLFAAVTRAVRTPSRVETDYTTTSLNSPAVPSFVRLLPNPDFESEELVAYEVGYRVTPARTVFVTATAFYNQHDDVLSTELATPFVETDGPGPPRLILPVSFRNGLYGDSRGAEVTADVRLRPWWRVTANYSFLMIEMHEDEGANDVSQEVRYERSNPRHQVQATAAIDAGRGVSVDWSFRYISALRTGNVPAYATSTIRLGWQVRPGVELAVVGRDLHERAHTEWLGSPVQIQRSAFVQVTVRR